jgi:hypothetical protein
MAYAIRGNFYNNEEQNIKYREMISYARKFKDKSGNFLDNNSSLNINPNDDDMYFAYNYAILGQTMKEKRLKLIGDSTNNVHLEDNLRMLSKELFSVTGYLDRVVDANNSYYKSFNHPVLDRYNPWIIEKDKNNVMNAEFGVQLGYNSRIELIAKNMVWVNRATKEFDIIRRHIVEQKSKDKRKTYTYGRKFEKIVENVLRDNTDYDGQTLVTEFLDKYSAYIYGDCDKDEMLQDDSYKKVEEIKNKEKSDITMDEVFKYLSLSTTESTLYQMKNRCIELAMMEISSLKKSRKMNGIRVCKINDPDSKSDNYDTTFQIVLPGYNSPFTVHANNTHLTDLMSKHSVKLENKDLHSPGFSACIYKYNNRQIEQIGRLKRTSISDSRIRRCVDYAQERCLPLNNYER